MRKGGGQWVVLGNALQPEFHVTSGKRRMAIAQATQFKLLNIEVTPELYDKEKWNDVLGRALGGARSSRQRGFVSSAAGPE